MHLLLILFTIVTLVAMKSLPAQSLRTIDVRFSANETGTVIDDSIIGYDSVGYRVRAEAGQKMTIMLSTSHRGNHFNIYQPSRGQGDEAMASSSTGGNSYPWTGTLPVSGEYTIIVYLMRYAARRGERSDYSLAISLDETTGEYFEPSVVESPNAGSDLATVQVSEGNVLNMRREPSIDSSIVTQLSNKQFISNHGCHLSIGRRWCDVSTLSNPISHGWVAEDFLMERIGETVSFKGLYTHGAEVRHFSPCHLGQDYWAVLPPPHYDKINALSDQKAERLGIPYQPVYIEVIGSLRSVNGELGFAGDYDGLLEVTAVSSVSQQIPESCLE